MTSESELKKKLGTDREMIAQNDHALRDWLWGITNHKPSKPGDFLKSLADAALRADWENYPLMRPMLLAIKGKYPEYCDPYPGGLTFLLDPMVPANGTVAVAGKGREYPDDNRCIEICPKCKGRCVGIRQHFEETKDFIEVQLHGCANRHVWHHGAQEIDSSRSVATFDA